jgi:PAS domain S-box-containing protein
VSDKSILVIEDVDSAGTGSSEVIQHVLSAGFIADTVGAANAVSYLRQAAVKRQEPLVTLIGPSVTNAILLARELRSVWSTGHLIFVQTGKQLEQLRRNLSRAPMIGTHWSVADLNDNGLPAMIADAMRVVQRRMKLRTTLDRANVQLTSHKPADSIDYRRLVLSEHYLTSFLAQAKDAIVSLDSGRQVLYWNTGAERLFGLSAKEAFGLPVSRLPFWSSTVGECLDQIAHGENGLTGEFGFSLSDREAFVEIAFSAVRDDTGGFIGTTLVTRDVSERHKMLEAERKEQNERIQFVNSERLLLMTLFDQAPGFMAVMKGREHTFELANQAYYELVGKRELIGKPVHSVFPNLEKQAFFELLDEVHATGKPFVGRGQPLSIQRSSAAAVELLYVDFVYQPIIESDGTVSGIFCQGHNVTQQKLAQDALLQHQAQLEKLVTERTEALRKTEFALLQSQKLEAIGKLTGGVAHDFNNILQVIAGNLELLQVDFSGNGTALARLKAAAASAERGAKLSSQLLAFARRQPLQPVATNLGRILREMDDLLRRALGGSIEIETIVGGGLWTVMVDRNQLENVILNLAINARDAMDTQGKLTLELGNAMLDDHYAL